MLCNGLYGKRIKKRADICNASCDVCVCTRAHMCMHSVIQPCPTLWHPMDCSPPGPSVHGILQARILDGLPFPSPVGSSRAWDWTRVSRTGKHIYSLPLSHLGSTIRVVSLPNSGAWYLEAHLPPNIPFPTLKINKDIVVFKKSHHIRSDQSLSRVWLFKKYMCI